MKLACRSAENLLLTDEVLSTLGTDWPILEKGVVDWLDKNKDHIHWNIIKEFSDSGFDRRNFNIKDIRNDLMGIIGSSRPREVTVGQTIARLQWSETIDFQGDGSIFSFLGDKLARNILPKRS